MRTFTHRPFDCVCQYWELFYRKARRSRQPLSCARGTGTGEKCASYSKKFRRHTSDHHTASTVVPNKRTHSIKDLTEMIVRTYAYPMAYGGFSDIWTCQLQHELSPPKKVAVKVIRSVNSNPSEFHVKRKAVEQELRVWAGLDHPNVLPLYGVTHEFGPFPAFVCPWADNGTLSEYLEKFEKQLNLKKRLTLLGEIAAGLQYLHSQKIVHGDLSGANVLIADDGKARLSDFGLSTLVEQVSETVSGICFPGNIRWAAPELLCHEEKQTSQLSSREADVYSFGSLMLQALSGKLPFHGVQRVAQIVIMISRGDRPPREPGWDGRDIPEVLWEFVQTQCWAKPDKRPSSTKIVDFIKKQLSRF